MPKVMKRSVCPYDCPDTCGLLVEVKDGKAVKVSGDPEHPFTRGTLCVKMNHYEEPSIHRSVSPIPCCEQEPKALVNFTPFPGKKPLTGLQRAGKKPSINMAQKLFFPTPMPEPWDSSSEMPGTLFLSTWSLPP